MLGWAFPRRTGDSPVTKRFWAWLASHARVDSRSEMSIRWPRPKAGEPGRSRPASAARIAVVPSIPVARSVTATPTFVGVPPSAAGKPVIDIRPDTA
jgi:hypothetical protein